MKINVKKDVLSRQNRVAAGNRARFEGAGAFTVNLMSSPGAGKTMLLEQTITALQKDFKIAVIEGDLATDRDAERLRRLGVQTVQINTVGGCHLNAEMIARELAAFDLEQTDMLFIENIGNLVCPSGYDLGQHRKVALLSTPEGNDKIPKYPVMFRRTDLTVVNKADLLPYVDFDVNRAKEDLRNINPAAGFLSVSAKTGDGMDDWISWLKREAEQCLNR
ncbi:hydrogenase nickel incorporation protein HypB [Alteribacter natronophilus]|uniref:hydrogenase nickel incorporation protein HypB n=1 Tax=Alteribacter natronophilus TaxID=2583810 RepID=UPI00110F393C|nr:hydrogenase nickel incorporation protein HypB [Alteribacter natronophilus]TMW71432.1 hydrogenase nickel incorporation protein HypB [Alteribacter natronophilus]